MNLKQQTEKGFTLIELMIVVAIIGILAAIAIPQFASFRVKAFNSAASADAKNGVTVVEGFYTDQYVYPDSLAATVAGSAQAEFLKAGASTTPQTFWNISEGVVVDYKKGATAGYCIASKHTGGDTTYAASDATSAPVATAVTTPEGTALVAIANVAACAGKDASVLKALTAL